jgi:hypothetical protein
MFTEDVTPEEVTAFSRLPGVPLLSSEVLEAATNREAYFASARSVSFPFSHLRLGFLPKHWCPYFSTYHTPPLR